MEIIANEVKKMNKLFLVEVMKNHKNKKQVNKEDNIDNINTIQRKKLNIVIDINDYYMKKKCNQVLKMKAMVN